ncbi:MAG: DUF3375 domain-containing protein [Puniceicoccales bacterium]|jgi:hypothetical protein|nr:DUF3375 domain-containing protein [Puniceicoccales bacterium]
MSPTSPIASLLNLSLTLKLLRAGNAELVLGFLYEAFKERNRTSIEEEALELLLKDHLAYTNPAIDSANPTTQDKTTSPENRARTYLNTWCSNEYRYLRKIFSEEQQCYLYQLSQYSEKVFQWLHELETGNRSGYTTTESRFSRIFNELKDLSLRTKEDPKVRLKSLLEQRDALDAEIQAIRDSGKVQTLQPAQVRDRLLDIEQMIEGFLADFRAIEDHFREQAHEIAEIYMDRTRSKGDVVEHALDSNERLRNSEQGKSYYGFRALLSSMAQREQLAQFLVDAAQLAANAGTDEHVFRSLLERLLEQDGFVQETFQKISSQLRYVVEENATQNTRRIMEQIGEIKKLALARRDLPPEENFHEIDDAIAWNNLMELRLHERKEPMCFESIDTNTGDDDSEDAKAAIRRIGKPLNIAGFRRNVATLLNKYEQVSLSQLLETFPPVDGAVDIVGYLYVAAEKERHLIDDQTYEKIDLNRSQQPRFATVNKIIFQRR